MKKFTNGLILLIAVFHIAILVIEMFFWDHPIGYKVFAMTPEVAKTSAVLAMNQGLYNGFLALGLCWGLLAAKTDVKVFFLSCILCAGVFAGLTAKFSIIFTQGMPALVALMLIYATAKASPSRV